MTSQRIIGIVLSGSLSALPGCKHAGGGDSEPRQAFVDSRTVVDQTWREPLSFSNALGLAVSNLKSDKEELIFPFFLESTNSAGNWYFSFRFVASGVSDRSNSAFVTVAASPARRVNVTGSLAAAARESDSQQKTLTDAIGLPCALGESLALFRRTPS